MFIGGMLKKLMGKNILYFIFLPSFFRDAAR